ncbi:MAG: hypothetical protein A3I07_03300 [Candidatus Doudnabacteria bacterium RIFCSPLOWO2_02_FULL_42_9]|uniref:Uncharacterized protein n=1 Tax=Candidatus Doudnabacteria bacterium RIFCSPHIGHO2_01_FULL_41_86 TaxID=1817821 RepID=A0A1F5N7U0_9BACT|nr:MAG: hypothetical protein A2717_03955 [Candidatus Doudnabacteria bacterium RIFCSPHIGHO2_01_FULL_41_86]OGE74925.1 MAG: hypothetical protein A3K07_02410 [Candidatus Doudnabacteria bacterium RIFCSPHIGHO2_01_43_10]OGE85789.1 MAG: hypothetical protein A3E28_03295 [Candidatus Doudnabacteria bacterium RIFCSPHIGHO2_12_FULL_42_22]OGE87284.1 MAG: hypothetical protein A3C49_00920 [Candidatus Doudnabacteria bacterium RIFCSPHIGHO2_02_FULL_42_25]OGE92121.1 MAG: hypothetical protein A2895_00795 [Candidatus
MANAVDENKDQEFKDDLDAFNQQQRLEEERRAEEEASQQQNQNQNSPSNPILDAAKDKAKQIGKEAVKGVAKSAIAATAPYWGTALAVLVGIGLFMGLLMFIAVTTVAYCNQGGLKGFAVNTLSNLGWLAGLGDFCEPFDLSDSSSGGGGGGGGFSPPVTGKLTEFEARNLFSVAGIPINKVCTDVTTLVANPPGQTCLVGINRATVDEVIALKTVCPSCSIVVTGGTEPGHEPGACSHANGFKIDIDDTANVNTYITSNFKPSGARASDGAALYTNSSGAVYARESNHWDIVVGCA